MSASEILRRLRLFLTALAFLMFLGTLIELWLVGHTEDTIQWVPFVLCALGILSIAGWFIVRNRFSRSVLTACMLLVAVGGAFGVYQHVSNNIAFEKEIHPNAAGSDLILKGLGGANPLLAPGTLSVAALLALAATYKYSGASNSDPSDVLT